MTSRTHNRSEATGAPVEIPDRSKQAWRWQHYLSLIGGLFLLWGTWTIAAWLIAGPRPVTAYRDPASTAYAISKAYEVIGVLLIVGVGGWVVRGCLRQRRVTFDAQMCLAGLFA